MHNTLVDIQINTTAGYGKPVPLNKHQTPKQKIIHIDRLNVTQEAKVYTKSFADAERPHACATNTKYRT